MKFGFRARLMLAAALPAVLAVVLLLFGYLDRHTADLEQALRDRAIAAARQLATAVEFPLFAGDREGMEQLVLAARNGDGQILAAAVFDEGNHLRAASGALGLGRPPGGEDVEVIAGDPLVVLVPVRRTAVAVGDIYFDTALARSPAAPRVLGHARVEVSRAGIDRQRSEMHWRVAFITLGTLLFAALLSMAITSSVTGPIAHVSQVVARIEAGDLQARADPGVSGVFATLAAGINDMAAWVAFTQEELRQKVALATEELRLQKEVAERAARVDVLTGVANRRAFAELAESEVQRALRYGTPMSLIMVDIDHFKAINDRHGHQTGDHVLIHFARTLAEHLREVDAVGRWGGEEFLVLLPDTRAGEAEQAAERMRGAIAAGPGFAQGHPVTCTASFGVGEFDPRELSFDCLLDRVDAALYRAKIAGRNRVERAAPLVPAASET